MKKSMIIAATLMVAIFTPWSAAAQIDVWLDVDPAAGLFERDVDDALAMIQAFNSPELVVRGVSVVYGNAPLEDGIVIARDLVERFGPEGVQVHRGAASAEELNDVTPAVEAMAAALKARRLTILALGPLTNVGALLLHHPELADRIESLVAVAGRRYGQRFTTDLSKDYSFPDFNFEHDPEAMQIILDSPVDVVLAPWEVSSHVFITGADLEALEASGGSGAWIAERAESWINRWRTNLDVDGFNPFDTLAVGWLTHPELIRAEPMRARIVEGGPELGGGPPGGADADRKPYLLCGPNMPKGRAVTYCYRPEPAFKLILMQRLLGARAADGTEG